MPASDNCLAIVEENTVLEFLARAVPKLAACGMQPASLDLLDAIAANPDAFNRIGERAGLMDLAREWLAPFPSDLKDAPATMRAAVLLALEADGAEQIEFGFRTFASDESEHWNLAGTPVADVKAFGLYLFCEGEATYCCSFTPSSWCEALQNVFAINEGEDVPRDQHGRTLAAAYVEDNGLEYEAVSESSGYFGYFGDRKACDAREAAAGDISRRVAITVPALGVDVGALAEHAGSPGNPGASDAFEDFATLTAAYFKTAREAAWNDAREYFQGNTTEPAAIWRACGLQQTA